MKKYLILMLVLVALGACSKENTSTTQQDDKIVPPLTIFIKGFAYSEPVLTIKLGETVGWANMDMAPHTVTSDSGNELDSGTMKNIDVYSHTFNEKGTFGYYCTLHPNMKGKIIVE